MPKNESERPLTPEEMRWRAAAWDPEKWLAEYRRREAAKTVRMQRRALWFWGALFTAWAIFGLFAEPDKFTFTDSLLLIMILVNVFNSIKELIRNKRIAAEKNAAETSEDAPVAK